MTTFSATVSTGTYGVSVSGESWDEVKQGMESLGLSAAHALLEVQGEQESQHLFTPDPKPSIPLREPPSVDPKAGDVVKSDEPRCQECGDPLAPLTTEDALELYGIKVCIPCGKDL